MSMSSIEVSLIASNHKIQSGTDRSALRAQRPPPPPPPPSLQSQFTVRSNEKMTISTEPETPLSSTATLTESVDHGEKKDQTTLLSEFKQLFDNFDYESIREQILDRKMIECNFTTVLWRIFLHCLPRDSNQWNEMIDTSRKKYEKIVQEYKIDPYQMTDQYGDIKNHPLSRDEDSAWAQYFADEELKATITIDVRRTCPDITFFRNPRMIDLQLRVLFTHSRYHDKTIPYRQGMHEILGIIVYSIYSESLKVNEYPESNESMKKLYDAQYLEHDSYAIYEKIMEHLRQFYTVPTNHSATRKSVGTNDAKQIPFQRLNEVLIQTNDTVTRMNSIFESLKRYDRLLHCKLEELNIEPTVYGIRWLRVLFGREIPFESIPKLWTVIFCFDEDFGFVDYFFIALLIQVGQIIGKQGDLGHTSYLQSLMKQNVITNAEPVIRKALTLTGRELPPMPDEPIIPLIRRTDGTPLNPLENDRENTSRTKQFTRIFTPPVTKPRLTRPEIPESRKSVSPSQPNSQNSLLDSIKRSASSNNAFILSSQNPKSVPFTHSIDSEMNLCTEKTPRQLHDENIRLQKRCGEYMNKFIGRLQQQIRDLGAPNEDELHIQLSGLKQIANVLDGKLTFDANALQALVDFGSEEKAVETNNSDMG